MYLGNSQKYLLSFKNSRNKSHFDKNNITLNKKLWLTKAKKIGPQFQKKILVGILYENVF